MRICIKFLNWLKWFKLSVQVERCNLPTCIQFNIYTQPYTHIHIYMTYILYIIYINLINSNWTIHCLIGEVKSPCPHTIQYLYITIHIHIYIVYISFTLYINLTTWIELFMCFLGERCNLPARIQFNIYT